MTPPLRSALIVLLCLMSAAFQDGAPGESRMHSRRAIERVLEHWRARPREERERLERHLAELEKLPQEARDRLLERARALREHERSLERDLSAELDVRQRADGPDAARELWRMQLHELFKARGRALRERLPDELRQQLEQIPLELRRRWLERLLGERERLSHNALRRMHERSELAAEELQRLECLPLPERLQALRELRRANAERAQR